MFNRSSKTSLAISFFLTGLALLSRSSVAQQTPASPVKTASVQEVMMAPTRPIPANVQAKFITIIKAESKGIVNQLADIGQYIQQGEILAELTDTQSKLKQQELNDAVKSARARYQFLKSENARLNNLLSKKLISNSELEKNQSDFLAAKSELNQTLSRLKQYEDQITKLTLLAPFDGYVMQQLAQPGQLLNPGNDVLEFMQANNLEVVVNVPLKYKSQIRIAATWKIQDVEGKASEAKISQFIPAATGKSHTIEVHLLINDNHLWPGEAINVLVPTRAPQKVIAVPRDALVIRKNNLFVYTLIENKAQRVDVLTGMAEGEFIEVKGSLTVGDRVVVRGNERLRNGQAVKIINH